jgi:hypothetical protein
MQKPKMLIGQKGVKYGLITRKDEKKPQAAPGRLAVFGGDSDSDEDNIEAQVARQAARKVADHKVTHAQGLDCMIWATVSASEVSTV